MQLRLHPIQAIEQQYCDYQETLILTLSSFLLYLGFPETPFPERLEWIDSFLDIISIFKA
jgi:hypothetical protein